MSFKAMNQVAEKINRSNTASERITQTGRKGASPEQKRNYRIKRYRKMFGYIKAELAENERALMFRKRSFEAVLKKGEHRFIDLLNNINIETYDISEPEFEHELLGVLLKEHRDVMEKEFSIVELTDNEVALVYKDGNFSDLLIPGTRKLYWKGIVDIRIEKFDINEQISIDDEMLGLLAYSKGINAAQKIFPYVSLVEIKDNHIGILKINGKKVQILEPGFYGYWKFNRSILVDVIDMRLKTMDVQGQEILTKDKVSLRVNLSANYRILDVEKAYGDLVDVSEYLYKEFQFGLREAVGTRTLDELLSNKEIINKIVFEQIRSASSKYGIEIERVGVKDIILPGDMKEILNQVVEAEKTAQANVIKRREETSATRSLLNTAKVMENNPILLRLKELEVLEKVTEKVDNITVYGGMDSILQEIVKIRA